MASDRPRSIGPVWKVLVTAPRACGEIDRYHRELQAAGCEVVVRPPAERFGEDELLTMVGDIDGIICGDDRITARVLDAAPRMKVIAKWGTGIDSIDVDDARARGIAVCNTPDAFSDPVADSVMGYVLLFTRHLDAMARDMRAGLWRRQALRSLSECALGIVGLGSIGRAVASRAGAFGMRVLVHDAHQVGAPVADALHVEAMPLDDLLAVADFVTLHATLRPSSRHLIDRRRLSLMRPSSVLINTARGGLIDEAALVAALHEGRIAGAALDVFEEEPLPGDHPLRQMANVYLAPHNANASHAAAERVHTSTIRNLLQSLAASTL